MGRVGCLGGFISRLRRPRRFGWGLMLRLRLWRDLMSFGMRFDAEAVRWRFKEYVVAVDWVYQR